MTRKRTPDVPEAIRLIEEYGWANGPHQYEELCLLQALALSMGYSRFRWAEDQVLAEGERLFAPIIRRDWPDRLQSATQEREVAWAFNDHQRTTEREVLTLLREAAAA